MNMILHELCNEGKSDLINVFLNENSLQNKTTLTLVKYKGLNRLHFFPE